MPNLDTKKLKEELSYFEQLAAQKQTKDYVEYIGLLKALIEQFDLYGKDGADKEHKALPFDKPAKEKLLESIHNIQVKTQKRIIMEESFSEEPDGSLEHLNNIQGILKEDYIYISKVEPAPAESLPDNQKYQQVLEMQNGFEALLAQIKEVDPRLVKSSKEFKNVKTGIEDLIKYTKAADRPIKEEALKEILNKTQYVTDMAELYVANKALKPGTTKLAGDRLQAMKNVYLAMKNNVKAMHNTLGTKAPTCVEVAKKMLEEAEKKIGLELDQKKPNLKELKLASAQKKYAEQLLKTNPEHLYNKHLTQRAIERLVSSPDLQLDAKILSKMQAERYKLNALETLAGYKQYINSKVFFPEEYIDPDSGKIKLEYASMPKNAKLGLSTTRNALEMLAICHLIKQGHSLQDIFDAGKLKKEKLEAGSAVMELFENADVQSIANVTADYIIEGLKVTTDAIAEATSKMKSFGAEEFCKPENRFMLSCVSFLQDLGQETSHTMIKDACKQLIGEKALSELCEKQSGVNMVLKGIGEGPLQAASMLKGTSLSITNKESKRGLAANLSTIKADYRMLVKSTAMSKLLEDNMVNGKLDIFKHFSMPKIGQIDPNNKTANATMLDIDLSNTDTHKEELGSVFNNCVEKNTEGSMQVLSNLFFEKKIISSDNIAEIGMEGVKFKNLENFSKISNLIPQKQVVKENVL